jgi:hypothetical protein
MWCGCGPHHIGGVARSSDDGVPRQPVDHYYGQQWRIVQEDEHLLTKASYVRERIEDGNLVLKHMKTMRMVADLLTKPFAKSAADHSSGSAWHQLKIS